MNKYIERIFIFISGILSGFIFCGAAIGRIIIKSEHIREAISNSIANKVESLLYDDIKIRRSPNSYLSYHHIRESRERLIEQVLFDNRADAEKILETMKDILKKRGVVTVSDYCDLADIFHDYQSEKYGWYSLKDAQVVRTKNGYSLKFPIIRTLE